MSKKNTTNKINWFKISLTFFACLLFRLIPGRPANFEPLLSAQMPISKRYGAIISFIFGFTSIFVYDILTIRVGLWTLITAVLYGLIGVVAYTYFAKRTFSFTNTAVFASVSTILYDALTGLTIGPIFFGQNFYTALIGQIPFTVMHLIGNVTLSVVLAPLIYKFFQQKPIISITAPVGAIRKI